jgi:hypothetical protein
MIAPIGPREQVPAMPASSFDPARINALVAEMERTMTKDFDPVRQHCFRRMVMAKPPMVFTDPQAGVLRIQIGTRGSRRDFTGC